MGKKYNDGQIRVNFKPDTDLSDIEKIVAQYKHVKTFGNQYDASTDPLDQQLARSYVIHTDAGQEDALIQELKSKYGGIIAFAERIPARKIMGP